MEQSRNQTATVQRLELELQRKTEEYQNVKERYQRELEQSQLQYQEAVEEREVQKNVLQHELKESRAREQQSRKKLNDMRGQEVLISKERNEASKSPLKAGVSHKKSRNVPVSICECMQMTQIT